MLIGLLRRHLLAYRTSLSLILFFQLAQSVAALYLPSLNADIIDQGLARGDIGLIWRLGGLMLVVTVVNIACTIVAVYFGARTAMAIGRDLRGEVFDAVETFSAQEISQFGAPTLITRGTNDVQQVQLLIFMLLTLLVVAPIMAVGGVIMALRQDVQLSGLLVVVLPVLVIAIGAIIRRMRPLFRRMQERVDELNDVMREQIQGVRVVRAFVKESHEAARYGAANERFFDVALAAGRIMALMFPTVMLTMNVSVVLATWFGGYRIASGDLQVGTLTAFQTYLIQILMAVMMATFLFMLWPRAEVAAERIVEVCHVRPSVVNRSDATARSLTDGTVRLVNASFSYPGAEAPVLHDVDISAEPGRVTAIIGSTGSGKSTIVNLITRMFDVSDGSVSIGGHDVRSLTLESVWDAVGVVPQRAFLFSGTVASNLRFGRPDATDDELWAALEVAQAAEFVRALPDGLASVVAQGGTNFSGGQRQRLAIARAVVKRPLVYLFDDSFSALDYATDARLRQALTPITAEATVIVVAQRVSTIRDADQIVVVDEGRVVGAGTHSDLVRANEVYREIVLSQLTPDEAGADEVVT